MIKTGGNWDTADRNVLFVASGPETLNRAELNRWVLIAINELSDTLVHNLDTWLDAGRHVFLDSGIFNLTMEHARAHDCPMDQALALAPHEIDGFEDLLARYLKFIGTYGERAWGYIELDQGGRENKVKTRAMLEAKGLRPIPVYHPLNDGWDYFDELASKYDRICLGNIVHAEKDVRVRVVRTVVERKRKYPHLWIHGLGMGPIELLNSLWLDSADASSWLFPTRWPKLPATAAMKKCAEMGQAFFYRIEADKWAADGHAGLRKLLGFDVTASQAGWRHLVARQKEETAA